MSSKTPVIKLVKWTPTTRSRVVSSFLNRPSIDPLAEKVAARVLKDIRKDGNRAVLKYAREFDGSVLTAAKLPVPRREIAASRRRVDDEFKAAAQEAHDRIVRFSKAGLRKDWQISTPKGGQIGERFVPLDRVGAYVPGGAAPLASTALMTVALAKVAGVPEIVACTPSDAGGNVNPYILYALELAGATEVYRVGGIQAIGAMAYGTRTIRKVQKIVGPGGPYVTAAKRLVYGDVDLDLVAGPSEIGILADDSAHAAHMAADLLSQAEHGTGSEKALFVTSSAKLAEEVRVELIAQAEALPRTKIIHRVLKEGLLLVVVKTLDDGMDLMNQFAPEHFELVVREPRSWLRKVKSAGAVFVGPWTPECAGDFVAGPSHVLPTGGSAKMFSGLTVDDFQRRTSVIAFTQADLKEALPHIEAFGRVEDLAGHAMSARIRFQSGKR